jgi:hypothetical protein
MILWRNEIGGARIALLWRGKHFNRCSQSSKREQASSLGVLTMRANKVRKMKAKMFAVLALMLSVSVSGASAQYFYAVIDVPSDQKAYIKDYVLRTKVRPILTDERISMGATVPPNIPLLPVPAAWGPSVQTFAYFVSDDRVHFVDPQSRRVVLDIF